MVTKKTGKTAVVYCRVSGKGQKDADTIEAQRTTCKQYVEQYGVTLIPYGPKGDGWIMDDGISGSLLEGRSFKKFVEDLWARKIHVDYLIVSNMNRLSRHDKTSKDRDKVRQSARDQADIMACLNVNKVQIIDHSGINDPASVVTEIKQTLAGEEYADIRRKTMNGKARVLANGAYATGGPVPYGYKRVPINGVNNKQGTTLAIDPVNGDRFIQIMRWYVEGGLAHAARQATKAGWPGPKGGPEWFPSALQHTLNKIKVYLGEATLTVQGTPYTVQYPALLDTKLYSAIVRRQKERTLKHRTTLLSTGYVDCMCGHHVHGHRGAATDQMPMKIICGNLEGGRCGSIPDTVFSKALWELVVARLIQIKEHERIASNGKDPYGPQLTAAKARLTKVQDSLERLVSLYAEGEIDKAALTKSNEKLRNEKAAAQVEVDRLESARAQHAQRLSGERSVQSKVQETLARLREGHVPLEGKRQILSDLLQGERAVIQFHGPKGAYWVTITLPAFGSLAPVTIKSNQDICTQMHGVSRQTLEAIYSVDDEVSLG
jgi:DNA invertase Pin-like site-specific DNA recombinase